MASLNITIKKSKKHPRGATIEFDADQFEKLAALFGLYNPEFLKDLDEAERDIKAGRIRKIKSLKDLR